MTQSFCQVITLCDSVIITQRTDSLRVTKRTQWDFLINCSTTYTVLLFVYIYTDLIYNCPRDWWFKSFIASLLQSRQLMTKKLDITVNRLNALAWDLDIIVHQIGIAVTSQSTSQVLLLEVCVIEMESHIGLTWNKVYSFANQ